MEIKTDKLGGRKFVLALISIIFMVGIFIVMYISKWLTANYCMTFINSVIMLMAIFVTGNVAEKVLKKGEVKK